MQQATINLPSTSPVRAMTGLAKVLALPAEHAPDRLPSYPALERTAVVGFNQPARLPLNAANDVKVMLTRQAAFPCWASTTGRAAEIAGVDWYSDLSTTGSGQIEDYSFLSPVFLVANGVSLASADRPGYVGDLWDNYPVGLDSKTGSLPWAPRFIGANAVAVVWCAGGYAAPVDINVTVLMDTWKGPGETSSSSFNATIVAGRRSAVIAIFAPSAASDDMEWFRPKSISVSTATASVLPPQMGVSLIVGASTLTHTTSTANCGSTTSSGASLGCFRPIVGPAEFSTSPVPYQSTRVTAVSLLCTNVTQVLNKNGTVIAGRLSPATDNPFTANEATLMGLHPAEKAWLPLETGLYTYCPPSTDLTEFWDYTTGSQNTPVYRLDNTSLVNVAILQSVGVVSSMALTVTTHLEFRTTSALFQIALSGYTLETLHVAQLALAAAGFFFENPEHDPVIHKIIKGVKRLEPFVAPAMKILGSSPYAQAAKTALKVGKAVVTIGSAGKSQVPVKAGPMKMKATSAKASGIVENKSNKGKRGKKPKK
jgi:hypothetical protein